MKTLLAILLLVASAHAEAPPTVAARESEWTRWIAAQFAETNRTQLEPAVEYRLADDSRIDIFEQDSLRGNWRGSVAWEVERAAKWKEAIGQAAYYHAMSGASVGGVLLLVFDSEKEKAEVLRCAIACKRCGLWLWTVDAQGRMRVVIMEAGQ